MNIPNQLSTFRIVLVPIFVVSLFYFPQWAAAIFFIGCVTDAADGYLARLWDKRTELGSYLDPVADKLLLLSGFTSLSFMEHLPDAMRIPVWITIAVISRDMIIVIGSMMIFVVTGSLKAEPRMIGKITTVFQMATLFFLLLGVGEPLRELLLYTTFALTVISGLVYLRIGSRLLGA